MFAEQIKNVVDNVEGSIGGLIMGLDGIALDHYLSPDREFDLNTVGMEFSFILTQVRKAGEILEIGGVNEFLVKSEGMTLVIRMINEEYFLAGDDRILFSPASVDFGGVCITPVEKDFHRITPEILRNIFEQVSVTAEDFQGITLKLRSEFRNFELFQKF